MTRLIQAALNGARTPADHPAIPVSTQALARDAAAAVEAGAGALHVHPRRSDGRESLDADTIATTLRAIRSAVPGVPVGVSTGLWIAPGGDARHAAIAEWTEVPDYVSLNLCEPDAPQIAEIVRARGIGIEAGIWSRADLERLFAMPWAGAVTRVLIEVNEQDVREAQAVFDDIAEGLARAGGALGRPILSHGLDAAFWPIAERARAAGHDLRVGLEDVLHLPDGTLAPDNAALVRALAGEGADRA